MHTRLWLLPVLLVSSFLAVALAPIGADEPRAISARGSGSNEISFNRDVRPILSQHCMSCHGPDARAREAGLRLDDPDSATGGLAGEAAVVPGDPGASLLMQRITSVNEDERMPPAEHGPRLTQDEIATLHAWIEQGAVWETHWAFVPPARPNPPVVDDEALVRHPIDRFVLRRLESEGLSFSPEADRRTLIRRLSFDLRGLPPGPDEIDTFLSDESPGAYERLVRRLLDDPAYGERMAVRWLDLARYADTNGYSIDGGRHMWAWRDWVIAAFNDNMPFDRFTIEQLAGDLLPEATLSQRIASGFNRNHMITHEGGTIPEEYRVAYVADRVSTTAQTWLGLTMGCAQCHDHKYDPISQQDYYRFFAFFNTITDRGNDGNAGINSVPFIPVFSEEQEATLAELREERSRLHELLLAPDDALDLAQAEWERRERAAVRVPPVLGEWRLSGPHAESSGAVAFATQHVAVDGSDIAAVLDDGSAVWTPRPDLADGIAHPLAGANSAWYLHRVIESADAQKLQLSLGSDDAIALWCNGESVLSNDTQRGVAPDQERVSVTLRPGENHLLLKVVNYGGPAGFYFRALPGGLPEPVAAALAVPAADRDEPTSRLVREYFRSLASELEPLRTEIAAVADRIEMIETAPTTTTMVMQEMAMPRETFVLERGRYDLRGERVEPDVPDVLPDLDTSVRPSRLDLADWLTDPSHPLTSRVAVNGMWQMVFGRGLVRTSEDFGTRGERPTHPELLDWLAVEFVESGWDVKELMFLIVTSTAYRQQSAVDARLLEIDPDNALLARGARFRLHAEFIRDLALSAGGLLVDDIGGPSVRPYQPPGLWEEMSHFGSTPATEQVYRTDTGEKLYRRSMYTIWKRTVPPPTMVAFDAPNREWCTARRARTNTPLQALVMLNETGFVEASRALAQRMINDGGATPIERLSHGFVLVTAREPAPEEAEMLLTAFEQELEVFRAEPAAAEALLAVGESRRDESIDASEHAAWTVIANLLLNLSEAVTRG